ncbi:MULTISPECIES: (Fe-S)-binding protein [Thermoactinomyces]|jgi:L-lactate dehydrogenase complex protein LldE|uniref:Lactate utilization protein A n=1 Tax=Thermoactinomyces daqus TaxID=1329516 RepID=A0A7W2AI12_9BACL|nr:MULTISPECIES: (Fe-S)-binding protein [Thermoactinomyces]MBA4542264.1 (Fe-S)-binding protein [Thermoactinomyces daqus]MBH8598284.1 (Fe-S)-binding protein [Thermoactinomyces sp. CICC 10523]MBH8604407.1 (Fe-S)-binding protein [Thermoactinomyces sp. CICC 10522]MBH8608478.1 (Fe-S)-binding protein [Thermoactinomyces sp. CICC 10521]
MRVSLFVTCLTDVFFPEVGKAVVEILERLGCEVDFPETQTCCGQPAYNSGYHLETKEVAEHMIETFEPAEYIVTPSGSCAAMFHEYEQLFSGQPDLQARARALANRTYEFTQFLTEILQVDDLGAELHATATYHPSCHMNRLLGVTEAPYRLLENVKGLKLIPLPHAHDCCGFGGTFSVKMNAISSRMVDEKAQHIEETRAGLLIGADCSCLMNIGGRLSRLGKPVKVMHIAQVLNHLRQRGDEKDAD